MRAAAPRVCVITSKHLSSCPRMIKAADALHEAGYRVRVVYTSNLASHVGLDDAVLRSRSWAAHCIPYDRSRAPVVSIKSALTQRLARRAAAMLGERDAPLAWAARAYSRLHDELVAAAASETAELYYGGTAGGLAATAAAAKQQRAPYALDLEDFHSAEQDDSPHARRAHAQIDRIESEVMPAAAFLTTGSEAMADAYQALRGIRPTPIHNVFPRREDAPPDFQSSGGHGLRLYWFGQTIGPGRGLEEAVQAAGLVDKPLELHLRGSEIPGYVESLRTLAAGAAPALRIVTHDIVPPDELCRDGAYDVGLALEQTHVQNRRLCLSNKAFTYLTLGLAVAFTDTPGQKPLALDLGYAAQLYPPGDIAGLAAALSRWAHDPALLASAKAAAWEGAQRRWHWEHPLERGTLLDLVARVLS